LRIAQVIHTELEMLQGLLREAVWVAIQPRTDGVIRVLNPGAAQFGWTPYTPTRNSSSIPSRGTTFRIT
jgi:hypothetical protein